jgi:DNA-binding Lrp family transcriptional regulator
MTTRRQTANDDTLFWTLKVLQENPGVSQRTLAKEVGINVSTINFCLKALVEKGWIKMGNFSKNPDKLSYRRMSGAMCSGTSITASSIASAMRSMDDKRGSRLLLSISDRCCTDMPAMPETFSRVRRRWLRLRRMAEGMKECMAGSLGGDAGKCSSHRMNS